MYIALKSQMFSNFIRGWIGAVQDCFIGTTSSVKSPIQPFSKYVERQNNLWDNKGKAGQELRFCYQCSAWESVWRSKRSQSIFRFQWQNWYDAWVDQLIRMFWKLKIPGSYGICYTVIFLFTCILLYTIFASWFWFIARFIAHSEA